MGHMAMLRLLANISYSACSLSSSMQQHIHGIGAARKLNPFAQKWAKSLLLFKAADAMMIGCCIVVVVV
jgi:hypothetical protein